MIFKIVVYLQRSKRRRRGQLDSYTSDPLRRKGGRPSKSLATITQDLAGGILADLVDICICFSKVRDCSHQMASLDKFFSNKTSCKPDNGSPDPSTRKGRRIQVSTTRSTKSLGGIKLI